ncbi:MAG TPA: EscU/YscU/HrcU family type III secretion system export apparatus switch protein [Bacillota bacterium]
MNAQPRRIIRLQLFAEDRRHPATPRRRLEARRRGQVFRSAELGAAAMLLAATALVSVAGAYSFKQMLALLRRALGEWAREPLALADALALGQEAAGALLVALLPLTLGVAVTGLLIGIAQVGPIWSFEPITPRLNRINPLAGLQRMFSRRSAFELAKGLIKLALVGAVTYGAFRHALTVVVELSGAEVPVLAAALGREGLGLAWRAGLALAAVAVLDYLYERHEYERSLMMSPQELKEELRESEGDPQLRSRIRRRQRELAQARMLQEVRRADVVIFNPTHYAVALRYDPDTMAAPMCCAKGKDWMALRIREIARRYDITWVEDRFLARALYTAVEPGEMVPESLYQAVAEVLAFVWRLRGRTLADPGRVGE